MAEQTFNVFSGFYDAVDGDRRYTAADMNKPYSRVVLDGVFAANNGTSSNDLQVVSAGLNMTVTVLPGQAMVGGKWFESILPITVDVAVNDGLYSRIDGVFIRVNKNDDVRAASIIYREGTPASSPTAPSAVSDSGITEYRVASILIAPGVTIITNAEITDERGSANCPWVTGLIKQVDTSTLWAQYQAAYQRYYDAQTADFAEYIETQRQAWEDFLETLTSELSVTMNVVTLTSVYTTSGVTTTVPIGIPSYNSQTDVLQVFINGFLAVENTDYTVGLGGDTITLENALNEGQTINFVVFKSLIAADAESTGSMIQRLNDEIDSFMGDTGWQTIMLRSGVEAFDTNDLPCYRIVGNRVYLRGSCKGDFSENKQVGTIPVEAMPEKNHLYTVSTLSSGAFGVNVVLSAGADGRLMIFAASGTISTTDRIPLDTVYLGDVELELDLEVEE